MMSNTITVWDRFNAALILSFDALGYEPIEKGRKTGLHAISSVCNYEFHNSGDSFRLELWFGFSNTTKEPLRNIKMYEVLLAEKLSVEQLLGEDNVKWDREKKEFLRCVVFGEIDFDVSDTANWTNLISWSQTRVKLMDKALLQAFIKFPIEQK
jgi:hypothetical protein